MTQRLRGPDIPATSMNVSPIPSGLLTSTLGQWETRSAGAPAGLRSVAEAVGKAPQLLAIYLVSITSFLIQLSPQSAG